MARPKNPKGNTTPRRYTGGRPPEAVEAKIGKDAMKTLRALAAAGGRSIEDEAARLLRDAITTAWAAYDAEISQAEAKAWGGETL